jgi:hypothetical protein
MHTCLAMEVRKKYSEGLSGWHKEDCIWRDDHCSGKLYKKQFKRTI